MRVLHERANFATDADAVLAHATTQRIAYGSRAIGFAFEHADTGADAASEWHTYDCAVHVGTVADHFVVREWPYRGHVHFERGLVRCPRRQAIRHEPVWNELWLLLRVAEPDAYTRAVCRTNAVDNCLRKRWWRVLLVERFVRGHRRTLPHRNVPQRYVNAEYLRLLRGDSVSYADSATEHGTDDVSDTDGHAERGSHGSSNEFSDEHADVGTDFIAVI